MGLQELETAESEPRWQYYPAQLELDLGPIFPSVDVLNQLKRPGRISNIERWGVIHIIAREVGVGASRLPHSDE